MAEKRRRGAELEQAIFDATISLLDEVGFDQLTFEKVADRAGTSKPVLYRRWSSTFELAVAAVREPVVKVTGHFTDFQLTGNSLEEDLLQMLIRFREIVTDFGTKYVQLLLAELGRDHDKGNVLEFGEKSDLEMMSRVLTRASERGEHVHTNLSKQAKLISFTQIRYAGLVLGHIMTDEDLKQLVDEILLPIYMDN